MVDTSRLLKRAFQAAVDSADFGRLLPPHLPTLPRAGSGRLIVVGAGKAAGRMVAAVGEFYRDAPASEQPYGLVVTPYGHYPATATAVTEGRIEVVYGAHPVPDAAGANATARILALAEAAGQGDVLLCLLSGGGSALLCAPDGISLEQKAALTGRLLASGADIHQLNTVRKHLSRVKGGRLALAAAPARVITLAVSDVVGDDLTVIASGPTVPDPSSYADALAVLAELGLAEPEAREVLSVGAAGLREETPKPGDERLAGNAAVVVAGAGDAVRAAAGVLEAAGIAVQVLSTSITGEARLAGGDQARLALELLAGGGLSGPTALVSGGEATVTVTGQGRGGPNSEFALGFAAVILEAGVRAHADRLWLLAADTDGLDGQGGAAGALLGPTQLAALQVTEIRRSLANNDALGLLEPLGGAFVTGPTGANLNDLRIVLLLPEAGSAPGATLG